MSERNGLPDRIREIRIGKWMVGITGFYLVSIFLAPLLLPEDKIPDLSGRANTFDYATEDEWGSWGNNEHEEDGQLGHNQSANGGNFAWTDLDFYSAFVYGFGDLNCHQKHDRSWSINGNQLPVCARDVGIFIGAVLGSFVFLRRGLNRWTIRDSLLSIFPDEWMQNTYERDHRSRMAWGMAGLFILPMALDGGIQAITAYESTNFMRIITGTPFGFFVLLFVGAMFSAKPKLFVNGPQDVLLPANARLVSDEERTEADSPSEEE